MRPWMNSVNRYKFHWTREDITENRLWMPRPEGWPLYLRVGFRQSFTVPGPIVPGPLHSIPLALFLGHESFQTDGYQGHKTRPVSGRESGNPPWRAEERR